MAHERKHIKGQWTPGPEARQSARNSIEKSSKYLNRNNQAETYSAPNEHIKGQWTPGPEARQSARSSIEKTLKYLNRNKQPKTYPAPSEQIIGTSPQPYDVAGSYKKFLAERAPKVTIPYRRGHDPKKDISIIPQDTSDEIVEIKENKDQRVLDKVGDVTSDIMDKELQKADTTGEPPRPLGSVWEEALITLGPALAGILEPGLETGKIGLASQKHYLERKDLEQKRLDKLAGVGGSSSRYVPQKYTDEKGHVRWASYDKQTKTWHTTPEDLYAGYKPQYIEEPGTGIKRFASPNDPDVKIDSLIGNYNPIQKAAIDEARASLKSGPLGPQYQGMLKRYDESASAKSLLTAGQMVGLKDGKPAYEYNQIAGEAAKTSIMRMTGEVGTLSDGDIRRMGGDKSVKNVALRIFSVVFDGNPLTPKDRRNLMQIVDLYEEVTAGKIQEIIKSNADSFVNEYKDSGLIRSDFLNVLTPFGKVYTGKKTLPHKELGIKAITPEFDDPGDMSEGENKAIELKAGKVQIIDKTGQTYWIDPGKLNEALKEDGVELFTE